MTPAEKNVLQEMINAMEWLFDGFDLIDLVSYDDNGLPVGLADNLSAVHVVELHRVLELSRIVFHDIVE